mmetsp:Transcript_29644/g.49134  ORF Transcript_29644/g.49134 Transcript_29644/m.49134 type:complete len:223 (-) Transcript_29644:180-848(-)
MAPQQVWPRRQPHGAHPPLSCAAQLAHKVEQAADSVAAGVGLGELQREARVRHERLERSAHLQQSVRDEHGHRAVLEGLVLPRRRWVISARAQEEARAAHELHRREVATAEGGTAAAHRRLEHKCLARKRRGQGGRQRAGGRAVARRQGEVHAGLLPVLPVGRWLPVGQGARRVCGAAAMISAMISRHAQRTHSPRRELLRASHQPGAQGVADAVPGAAAEA